MKQYNNMTMQKLEGLIAAPFTPMKEDGRLHLQAVPEYYQLLKRNGVIGAFIIGSTGEGVSLTLEEKKQMITAWAEATKEDADFRVMALVAGTSMREGKELAQYSKDAGLYGVALTAPYYFKPANVQQLAACCMEIAGSVPDLPFYYYHIPVLNGAHFPMLDLLKEIDGKLDNFAGIKYTHEDFMDFLSCLHYADGKYDMLWGRDENMLSALVLGAKGAVGSTYNYAAPLYLELMAAFERNDLKKARALQQKSIDVITLLGKYGGNPVGKAYMRLIGLDCGEFRLPFRNMNEEELTAFQKEVEALGFDTFQSR